MRRCKNGNCVGFAYDDTAIVGEMQKPEWSDYEMPLDSILPQPWGLARQAGRKGIRRLHVEDRSPTGTRPASSSSSRRSRDIKPTKFAQEMHAKYK